jgi:hypothetical protein
MMVLSPHRCFLCPAFPIHPGAYFTSLLPLASVRTQDARDALFDPLKSTDLPFAKRMGVRPIERSVLYQKMNLLPKNRDGSTLVIDWNDKDQEAAEGKKMHGHFKDDKGHAGLTAHEATFQAAKGEDASRFVCNSALKSVRDAQSQLALRKSTLQVAVLESRQLLAKQNRAAKTGKFGSSEERTTVSTRTECNPLLPVCILLFGASELNAALCVQRPICLTSPIVCPVSPHAYQDPSTRKVAANPEDSGT